MRELYLTLRVGGNQKGGGFGGNVHITAIEHNAWASCLLSKVTLQRCAAGAHLQVSLFAHCCLPCPSPSYLSSFPEAWLL